MEWQSTSGGLRVYQLVLVIMATRGGYHHRCRGFHRRCRGQLLAADDVTTVTISFVVRPAPVLHNRLHLRTNAYKAQLGNLFLRLMLVQYSKSISNNA